MTDETEMKKTWLNVFLDYVTGHRSIGKFPTEKGLIKNCV